MINAGWYKIINLAWRCLQPGGIFVAFFPNGNAAYRRNAPKSWRNMWGDVHPNFLDDQFFKAHFKSQVPEFFARAGQDKDNYYELGVVGKKRNSYKNHITCSARMKTAPSCIPTVAVDAYVNISSERRFSETP